MNDTNSSSHWIQIINQLFDLEKKLSLLPDNNSLIRHVHRIKRSLAEMGYTWHNPAGEAYDETRTDCEASIAGEGWDDLYIQEVIKPIIWKEDYEVKRIVQRAVVIVKGV